MMRLRCDSIDSQEKVMSCDGACYVRREGEDTGDGFGGRSVFEDDSESGKVCGELAQVGEEMFFGIKDGDVLVGMYQLPFRVIPDGVPGQTRERIVDLGKITRYLTVKVQDHPLLLHSLEDRIVYRVVLDPGPTIRSYASRIALDPLVYQLYIFHNM